MYQIIMISPFLGVFFHLILKRKIRPCIEDNNKRTKGQASFRNQHATIDHLLTLIVIIVKDCKYPKNNLICCFVDFRKSLGIVPRSKLWKGPL
jgi:hypothetical protein